jgi:hypothetical protein
VTAQATGLSRHMASEPALGINVHATFCHPVPSSLQEQTCMQGNQLGVVKPSVPVWHLSFSFMRK